MGETEFTPRIVVRDDDDAEILFAALVGYIGSLSTRLAMLGAVDMAHIKAMHRATELAGILGEDLTASNVRKLAGEIPDDLSGLDPENGD
jgi:hypothetical protein